MYLYRRLEAAMMTLLGHNYTDD